MAGDPGPLRSSIVLENVSFFDVSVRHSSDGQWVQFSIGCWNKAFEPSRQTSRFDDPVQGPMQWRSVTTIVDGMNFVFEIYSTGRSGKEEKMMEITYTRK